MSDRCQAAEGCCEAKAEFAVTRRFADGSGEDSILECGRHLAMTLRLIAGRPEMLLHLEVRRLVDGG